MSSKKIKKEIQQKLADTLNSSVEDLKANLSPKKLKRNIKKASKALVAGLKVTPQKKATKAQATKTKKKEQTPLPASDGQPV